MLLNMKLNVKLICLKVVKVRQETRLWDTKDKKTIMMRSKEEAADYRYFPDPDLPLIEIDKEWISQRKKFPNFPLINLSAMFILGLSAYEAEIL